MLMSNSGQSWLRLILSGPGIGFKRREGGILGGC